MNSKINFQQYLQRYINGTLPEHERLWLKEALAHPENEEKLAILISEIYQKDTADDIDYDRGKIDKMIQAILKNSSPTTLTVAHNTVNQDEPLKTPVTNFSSWETESGEARGKIYRLLKASRFRYAAAVVLAGVVCLYIFNSTTSQKQINKPAITQQASNSNDVMPGSNKAVLTLSSGRQILLVETGQQSIADKGVKINNNNGALSYTQSDIVALNTMTTPRGGQYRLTLPDGTKVWLNAASSITYPTSFPDSTREVSITGEAYFEVTKNALKPFIVTTYKDKISVKGTSFNVNSYPDEPGVKTSLVEGLVQINNTLLKPGNAYVDGKIIKADLDKELAWKNGIFNFADTKLKDALRQIARWYDVDILCEGNNASLELGGEIGRNLTLKQVLNGLQDKDIHFKLEGKILTVYQ